MKKAFLPVLSALVLLLTMWALMFTPQIQAQGGVTGFANLRISNFYRTQQRPVVVVTMNGSLNPTGTNTIISSTATAALSGANITVEPSGTILILRNMGSNSITFTETGTLVSAGNIVLGTLDSATLLSNGTNWYQIGASNN